METNLGAVSRLEFDDSVSCSSGDGHNNNAYVTPEFNFDPCTPELTPRVVASNSNGANGSGGGGFTELERIDVAYVKLRTAVKAFKHYVPLHVVHGLIDGTIEARLGMHRPRCSCGVIP